MVNIEQKVNISFQILHAIYRIASSTPNLNEFGSGLVRILSNAFAAKSVVFVSAVPNKNSYVKVTNSSDKGIKVKVGTRSILSKSEQLVISECDTIIEDRLLSIPLIFINTLGFIQIKKSSNENKFEDLDFKIFHAIAEQVAICVKNFQLLDEHHRTVLSSIKTFTECLGFHTATSKIEMDFFNIVVEEMAMEIGLSQNQVRALEYAASLHDAGKFQISQQLLDKKKPLTDEEKDIIRNHPSKGAELFEDFDALAPVIPIIKHHHEKFDGTGYPDGLKGNKIPIEARIMAILDAFDAIYFGRSYREAISLQNSIDELKKNSGTQFDPELVEIFVDIISLKSIRNILNKVQKTV